MPDCLVLHVPQQVLVAGGAVQGQVELNFPLLQSHQVEEIHIKLRGCGTFAQMGAPGKVIRNPGHPPHSREYLRMVSRYRIPVSRIARAPHSIPILAAFKPPAVLRVQ